MRSALITGSREGELSPSVVIVPPGVPREVSDLFKKFLVEGGAGLAEIQLWDSGSGIIKKKKFANFEGVYLDGTEDEPELVGAALYETLTVPVLKSMAEERWLDVSGIRLKQEFIDLLVADDARKADELLQTKALLDVAMKENGELTDVANALKLERDQLQEKLSAFEKTAQPEQ